MHRRALGRDAEALQGPVRQLGDDGRFGPGEPLAADERVVDLMLRLAGPRLLAYQKLPREHAVGVRIGARADARVVREHFGCHIRAGPNDRRHLRQRVRQLLADPEVRDLAPNYAAALGYQHVARLEVTVYNSTRVQVREPRGDVARRVQDVLMDERPARILVNYVVEVPGHELGHDVEAVRGLAHAVEDEHVPLKTTAKPPWPICSDSSTISPGAICRTDVGSCDAPAALPRPSVVRPPVERVAPFSLSSFLRSTFCLTFYTLSSSNISIRSSSDASASISPS